MKRRNRLLSLCLCFALLLSCLPTVIAAENTEDNELDALKEELIASGRIERDKLENYIKKIISIGITEPDDQEKYIMASIRAQEAKEEIIQAMKDQGLDPSYYASLLGEPAEETAPDALEELKNELIASGRIEKDELENYINSLTALGITEPDKLEDFINAYITDKEMREEERKEVLKYAAEVDEEVRVKICGDYYAQHETLHRSAEPEDVFIRKYYGCYDDVHVVLMGVLGTAQTADELRLNIDDLVFDFSSGSCRPRFLAYHDGVFTQVADAYEQGLLKKSALLSILKIHYENRSYLPVGATEPIEAAEFETIINVRIAAQKAKEAADTAWEAHSKEEQENQNANEIICADFYNQNKYLHNHAAKEDVFIKKYYGCYNGVYVLLMGVQDLVYPHDMLHLSVGGLIFEFPSSGYEVMFLAYKDGKFIKVADAYEQGLLTKSDLISMMQIHYEDYSQLPFSDVDNGVWYEDAVWYAFLNGLFQGVDQNRFAPEDTLTRSMLATVLWRSQGEPASHPSTYFTDVDEESWYAEAVAWANREGIVYGTGGNNFSPDAPVTRETFATMLYRMSGADESPKEKNPSRDFMDLSTISSWAEDAVNWAIEEEILQGFEAEDGSYLAPTRPITRAEAATMLMRYMEKA